MSSNTRKETDCQIEKRLILSELNKLLLLAEKTNNIQDIKKEFTVKGDYVIVNPFKEFRLKVRISDEYDSVCPEYTKDTIEFIETNYAYSMPKEAKRALPTNKPKKVSSAIKYRSIPNPNTDHVRQKALHFGSFDFCERIYRQSIENLETAAQNAMSTEYIETLEKYKNYYSYILNVAKNIDFEVEKNEFLQSLEYSTTVLGYSFTRREILDFHKAKDLECSDLDTAKNLCFTHVIDTHFASIDSAIEYFETRLYHEKVAILQYCYKGDTVDKFTVKKLAGNELYNANRVKTNVQNYISILGEFRKLEYLD